MRYRYDLTPLAVSDIDDALDYISRKLLNQSAADNLYKSITREITRICDNPYSFPDCSYYLIDDATTRHCIIGNYVLFFEISEDKKAIRILRFLYGRMDISNSELLK